ncbi:MAG: glutathione S-transferase family protein [Pseudomonadota bacterium]
MEIERLVLHHYPASRSVRAKWMLHETVGDAFEVKRVDIYKGDQFNAEQLAVNPNHNVPVLEIHWAGQPVQHMLESAAIVQWLAERFPEKALAPTGAGPDRADYLRYFIFGANWMDMVLWQVRAQKHLLTPDKADPVALARYEQKFRSECEPQIADRLAQGDYILGELFSAADVIIGYNVFWARGYGFCKDKLFADYLDRLLTRPAFQKALSDAGEFKLEPDADALVRVKFLG